MIFNSQKHCIAVGKHEGELRELAHQVKTGDKQAIEKAADLMFNAVPQNAILVPIPGHEGDATYTYSLAKAISEKSNSVVIDAIQGFSRESAYESKKRGKQPNVWFYKIENVPESSEIIFIDNVVATGRTSDAARHALGDRGLTLAITLAYYEEPSAITFS